MKQTNFANYHIHMVNKMLPIVPRDSFCCRWFALLNYTGSDSWIVVVNH